MENELIKALRASSIATEDKNKAVMDAIEYAQKCDREQIEWNNKFRDALQFKAINNPTSDQVTMLHNWKRFYELIKDLK